MAHPSEHSPSEILRAWYEEHARELPWRRTKDPYFIWLSEVMLQQTRVEQGMPYYHRFTRRFPSVHDLAKASEDEVMKLWEGLGYYSRARNLHKCAKVVSQKFGGVFPNTAAELQALPGIGPYTSAAIASICFDEPIAVMDGNVIRFMTRLYGMEDRVDTKAAKDRIMKKAGAFIQHDPGTMNQALMEFGARHCSPKKPNCLYCPFRDDCVALAIGAVGRLPYKKAKKPRRQRYLHYFLSTPDGHILLRKRGLDDVWGGLYEFPALETQELPSSYLGKARPIGELISQTLSHQDIHARFYHLASAEMDKELRRGSEKVEVSTIGKKAFPRLIRTFLEKHASELV